MSDVMFNLDETSIGKLITEADDVEYNSFVIPPYQRAYDWKKEQWNMLLIDIERHIDTNDSRDLFLGTIITLTDDPKKQGQIENIRNVIDGQQRLTTIFILYIAIIEQLKLIDVNSISQEQNRRKLTNNIEKLESICDPKRLRHENAMLLPNHNETMYKRLYHTVFSLPISSTVDKRSRYFLAYKFFSDALKKKLSRGLSDDAKFDTLFSIVRVIQRAKIIWASVTELSFAIQMFDVLNSRGLPLSVTDIIRTSYLSGMLDAATAVSRDVIVSHVNNMWIELKRVVQTGITANDDKMEALFRRYLRHIYMLNRGTSIIESRMPDEYKKWMREYIKDIDFTKSTWQDHPIRDMFNHSACIYSFIHNPKDDVPTINLFKYLEKIVQNSKQSSASIERIIIEMLYDITNLGLIQINLLLLIVFSTFVSDSYSQSEYDARVKLLKQIVNQIWRFAIRRNITDEPRPNDMDGISLGIINSLKQQDKMTVTEKLTLFSQEIMVQINRSAESLESKLPVELQYEKGSNANLRYVLHILEKWEVNDGSYVLRDRNSPFDGYETVNVRGTARLKWTIEHVLPQSLLDSNADANYDDVDSQSIVSTVSMGQNTWVDDLREWGSNWDTMTKDERNIIHSIGNLTLLDHNSNLSDKRLIDKQVAKRNGNPIGLNADSYLNTKVSFSSDSGTDTLLTTNKWTEVEIKSREDTLIKLILKLLV